MSHNDEHIGVGIHCLFLYVGSFRNLVVENKQKEVPRFFYTYTNGAFGANFPQDIKTMKKILSLSVFMLFLVSAVQAIVYEGMCGSTLSWSLDTESGLLSFLGS